MTASSGRCSRKPIDMTFKSPSGTGIIIRPSTWIDWSAQTEHRRHAGTVDIDVEQSDPISPGGQRDGQVDGDRAFADAPLARKDDDFMLDLFQSALQPSPVGRLDRAARRTGTFFNHNRSFRTRSQSPSARSQPAAYGCECDTPRPPP